MSRKYEEESKKDRFITEILLPFVLKRIDESDDKAGTTEKVASMCIFPFVTESGVELGSLMDPGISWYFIKGDNEKCLSSGSYRIFADKLLKPDQASRFRQTFMDYITEFSDEAVIRNLIKKMSTETYYSQSWWINAYDVFRLWNPENFNVILNKATENISDNAFLFTKGYCSTNIQKELIKKGVFRDIIDNVSSKWFWNRIAYNERKKAVNVLINLGVTHTFTSRGEVNPYILDMFDYIENNVKFPSADKYELYDWCGLCHAVMTDVIIREDRDALLSLIRKNDHIFIRKSEYIGGIVVKNVQGEYVPLSWDLFYSDRDYERESDKVFTYLDDEYDYDDNKASVNKLESLHIDTSVYDRELIEEIDSIHEFASVDQESDKYYHGLDCSETDFYKWIWSYSHHTKLAEHILRLFSDDEYERVSVPQQDVGFVLDVLADTELDDDGYCFDIDIEAEEAFKCSEVINKTGRNFEKIFVCVSGEFCHFDKSNYPLTIAAVSQAEYDIKNRIANDPIWDHIYLVSGDKIKTGMFDDKYVYCFIYDEDYKKSLILYPSDTKDSYVRALESYVSEFYKVTIAESYDWKSAYIDLAKQIRSFISEKYDKRLPEDFFGFTSEMGDVPTFGEEKKLWKQLEEQKEKIISQDRKSVMKYLEGWREYLAAKYKGRCQLCGGKTITGVQNAHFYTYRMVKKSKNGLADLSANMFCLCPSCHGEMGYGGYMGKDMTEILRKASEYTEYLERKLESGEMEDDFPSLIQELADDSIEIEGFHNPIVCDVTVNGKERKMAFSWDHFMRIAFILHVADDYEESDAVDVIEEDDGNVFEKLPIGNFGGSYGYNGNREHYYEPWHGTEWVSGHWRNRNGNDEWVTGHWRTR